jgi:uncharacterized protein YgiM (DUF1202 family)
MWKKLLVLFVFLAQSAFAYSAITTSNVNLRLEPSQKAKIIKVIQRSSKISVAACASNGWCRVRASGRLGYMRSSFLRRIEARVTPAQRPAVNNSGRGYTNSQGNRIQSPVRADAAPSGASALCRDGTYSFSASRRGTCSRHGGVAQWLP